jgi:hypothetical protein
LVLVTRPKLRKRSSSQSLLKRLTFGLRNKTVS